VISRVQRGLRRSIWSVTSAIVLSAMLAVPVLLGQAPARDPAVDMAMKISESFTLASVGDLIIMRPANQFGDPGFQNAVKLIRDADVGFGNLEGSISDTRRFEGPTRGFMGAKEVAADVKAMGFDLVNRANNHLFDATVQGMWATNELLDEAGVVHAGAGKNLQDARAAQFFETPKGRVGLVGMTTLPFNPTPAAAASFRVGNTGGAPGFSAVNLTRYHVVNQQQLNALRAVRDGLLQHRADVTNPIEAPPANEPPDVLQLFGTWYKVGSQPGDYNYVVNADDLRDVLHNIRNGKQYSDFMIATIHTHDGHSAVQRVHFGDYPPDFLIELARKSIDNGADAFVGHGVHVLRGIEIYKGKPIFYGMGEFFRQMDWTVPYTRGAPNPDETDAEAAQFWTRSNLQLPINYESIVAQSRFEQGQLAEVRLTPIEGRHDAPYSRRGIPRLAPPEVGRRILERLQELSKPFDTTIVIEGGVGVIKIAPSATNH
jgi:poly-gamma-glutamate capsule biosynthesis protein CapA/YwtB (metallophosphatase superfamily)